MLDGSCRAREVQNDLQIQIRAQIATRDLTRISVSSQAPPRQVPRGVEITRGNRVTAR